jgi:hypothetical protein
LLNGVPNKDAFFIFGTQKGETKMRKARREKCNKCGERVAKGRMRIHMLSHTEMAEMFAELRAAGFSPSVAGRIVTEKLIEQSVQRHEKAERKSPYKRGPMTVPQILNRANAAAENAQARAKAGASEPLTEENTEPLTEENTQPLTN